MHSLSSSRERPTLQREEGEDCNKSSTVGEGNLQSDSGGSHIVRCQVIGEPTSILASP
jgi:hypothetical protein